MSKRRPTRPERRRWGRRLAAAGGGAALLFAGWTWLTWPDVARLAHENPRTTAFIGRYEASHGPVEWRWVGYGEISRHLKRAVLVSEDINFFDHAGFDREQIRAALDDWRSGQRLRGASTVSQQLAKNLWLSPSRSAPRKLKEALLTRQLERHLDKRRILEIYLNVVQFGPGVFGAGAAAQRYFGKPAARLSPHEAALLAAALPRPSTWYPGVASDAYRRRAATIERRAATATWLDRNL